MKRISIFLTLLLFMLSASVYAQDKQNASLAETGGKQVVYLETASWGQNSPFNLLCWTNASHTTHAKTGCVPTAYAIVMRYHKKPNEGIGRLYDCQLGTEITDRTYDWDSMPLVYDGNWTDYQKNEVAKIMSHLGHAFMVSYGAGSTSVSDSQSTHHPSRVFDYNKVDASYQRDFSREEWENAIRESLDNRCPVIYAANNSGTGDSRHMFVIDGYTDNGYFHFNFGWNGSGNGWFKLDDITPYQGDNYSWEQGGSSEHYAIFNFKPNQTDEEDGNAGDVNGDENESENGDVLSKTYEYVISTTTGTLTNGSPSNEWVYTKNGEYQADLTLSAKNEGGTVKNIYAISSGKLSLNAYAATSAGNYYTTEYTISVPEDGDYKIVGYSLDYEAYKKLNVKNDINGYDVTLDNGQKESMKASGLDVYSITFTVSRLKDSSSSTSSASIDINDFIITVLKKSDSDDTSVIDEVCVDENLLNIVYDLTGRCVKEITKSGVYIVNGKKVYVK